MTKVFLALWLGAVALIAQPAQNPAGVVLANDKLELTIGANGARFSRLVLRQGEPLSPLAAIARLRSRNLSRI